MYFKDLNIFDGRVKYINQHMVLFQRYFGSFLLILLVLAREGDVATKITSAGGELMGACVGI